jgi:hypothetical protein
MSNKYFARHTKAVANINQEDGANDIRDIFGELKPPPSPQNRKFFKLSLVGETDVNAKFQSLDG